MSAPSLARGISRTIAWRLAAGVLPSVLAIGLVVGLFYYGVVGRAAPRVILVAVTLSTAISIIVACSNAAYFAERLTHLARMTERERGDGGATDEFDRIEQAVGDLDAALSAVEADRARIHALASARFREQATMLAGVVNDSLSQLDQVRLPLQILLESPFGELNDNQEEMLREARSAADSIDLALRRLGHVADIDRGEYPVQRELVQVNDVVRSVLPLARAAAAERRDASTITDLEPGLPRVAADRARLAEALSLFVADAAEETSSETPLIVSTLRDRARANIRIQPASSRVRAIANESRNPPDVKSTVSEGNGVTLSAPLVLAFRLIAIQGGATSVNDDALQISVGGAMA